MNDHVLVKNPQAQASWQNLIIEKYEAAPKLKDK